jgi:hemerythrin-like metal-binding protein
MREGEHSATDAAQSAVLEISMQMLFKWDPVKYSLGVPEMDSEHKTLIALMNNLRMLHRANGPQANTAKSLRELVKFTITHFTNEEAYMRSINYPGLASHAGVHRLLLSCLNQFYDDFERSGKLTDAFFAFLNTWLASHICDVDMKYAHHEQWVA